MKIISVVNQKGGCGKTTTAINLSAALSQKGCRTIIIDLDPQAHATYSMGLTNEQGICDCIEQILENDRLINPPSYIEKNPYLSIITSSLGLSALEHKINGFNGKLSVLKKITDAVSHDYEYCVIDAPPNLGILSINAVSVADHILVPFAACDLSLRGLNILNEIIGMVIPSEKTGPKINYLLTQYDRRFRYSVNFFRKTRELLGDNLLETVIRTNINLREAFSEGKTIFEYKPYSRGAYDYSSLALEIMTSDRDIIWTQFSLSGKNFKDVYVVGDFNQWKKSEKHKMKKVNGETWLINMPLQKGKYEYKFFADQEWVNDPGNNATVDDNFGGKNSIIHIE